MKIVIDIPEDMYDCTQKGYLCGSPIIVDAIRNGTPYEERPQGECKTCKYYHPYFEQFTDIPRGDGYCVIARMTPEGLTTINCNDEFGCSDYEVKKND